MIILIAAIFGFTFGWFRATRQDGDTLDKLQYGTGFAIAFALAGLTAVIILQRMDILV